MGLEETTHEVGRKLENWHDDLRKISNDLEHARSRFLEVKNKDTVETFTGNFEEFKKDLKELFGEVDHFSDKIRTFQKEVINSSAKPAEKPIV